MNKTTEKNTYTVLFAVGMVIIVGVILAGLFGGLRSQITENQRKEKQQNILFAMGINQSYLSDRKEDAINFVPPTEAEKLYKEFIKKEYVLQDGKMTESNEAFDIDVAREQKKAAADEDYKQKLPLYVGEYKGEEYYIVPVYGKGLWDAIWGYIALEEDLKTVKGVYFDHKGETPGLGANITQAYFQEDFTGEEIFDGDKFTGIEVAKGNNDPTNQRKNDHRVDAIAGATITGNGVTAMIKNDLKNYLPYFDKIK